MSARSANAWWLLPGAFALVSSGVLGLLGGQLSGTAVDVGTGLAWYLAGTLAYMARPANRAAWFLLVTATVLAIGKCIGNAIALASMTHPELAHDWVAVVIVDAAGWAVTAAGIAVFAMFPDGKYQRLYERWIVSGVPLAFLPLVLLYLLGSPRIGTSQFGWVSLDAASPLYFRGLDPVGAVAGAVIGANLLVVVPALALLLLRYRRFGAEQRLQIKWPLYALSVSVISVVVLALSPGPPAIPFWIAAVQYVGTMALLPAGLAMGIVMHRGLDIDDVIRRSVVYGALWAVIAAAYVMVAAGFGIAVGQRVPLALAVLLAIAATLFFQPARRRLEGIADRLVFGPRLSGYELISRLGVGLQSTIAIEDVAGAVARAVHAGLGASWVRVALDRPDRAPIATAGIDPGSAAVVELSAPLVHGDQMVGVIECGPKVEGRYEAADQELLNTLGRQARAGDSELTALRRALAPRRRARGLARAVGAGRGGGPAPFGARSSRRCTAGAGRGARPARPRSQPAATGSRSGRNHAARSAGRCAAGTGRTAGAGPRNSPGDPDRPWPCRSCRGAGDKDDGARRDSRQRPQPGSTLSALAGGRGLLLRLRGAGQRSEIRLRNTSACPVSHRAWPAGRRRAG